MTLNSAMNTAVSALKAQSQALSVISNNLANSSTTGYKAVSTSFSSLVTQAFSGTSYTGAGVTSSARQNVNAQGNIETTGNTTDLAINGYGMFVVSDSSGGTYFTRSGEFDTDDEGYLTYGDNYYLMGWPTDSEGDLTVTQSSSTLSRINVTDDVSSATPTTEVTLDANLGSNTEVSATDNYTTTMEVYDSLGNLHTVTATWQHTATDTSANTSTWTVSFASEDGDTTLGTTTMVFDGDGQLSTVNGSSTTTGVTLDFDWDNGASDSSIAIDLSSVSMTSTDADGVTMSYTADGYEAGELEGISIDSDGTVYASYDNGTSKAVAKIAIATFSNYDGLEALSNTLYQQTASSGTYSLQVAGEGSAGTITSSALESSTVDTADEFTKMIVAQQAYSAASQIITTAKDMYDALISAVR